MSLLIKGMEMPKDGYVDVRIKYNGTAAHSTGEPPYFRVYDAIPVPPHGRLIDIDAPYEIKVYVDGLTKKGGVDIYAPAVLDADPAEEGET